MLHINDATTHMLPHHQQTIYVLHTMNRKSMQLQKSDHCLCLTDDTLSHKPRANYVEENAQNYGPHHLQAN